MSNFYKINLEKIKKNKLNISIIGLGYVGLNLLIHLSETRNKIYGVDSDLNKISLIKRGKSYINYIADDKIKKIKKKSIFSSNYNSIKNSDVIILCLPTPLKNNKPDLTFLKKACMSLKNKICAGQVIILESTSYPGTTEEFLYKNLNLKRFRIGEDLFLGFSPEREDPGNKKFSLTKIPKVVSGYTVKCLNLIECIYKIFIPKVIKSNSIKVAETAKLLENVYRAVNVTLVNEIKKITNKMNIDIYDVINIAKTKPFGFQAFYPGPGLGGHCLPVDPIYLSYAAKRLGVKAKFIELTKEINSKLPLDIKSIINKKITKKKSKILLLGVTYKPDINDTRESAGIKLIELLLKQGKYNISFSDPYVNKLFLNKKKLYSIKISKNILKKFDCVVLITDHSCFNYNLIKKNSKILFDSRGKFKSSNNIIRI